MNSEHPETTVHRTSPLHSNRAQSDAEVPVRKGRPCGYLVEASLLIEPIQGGCLVLPLEGSDEGAEGGELGLWTSGIGPFGTAYHLDRNCHSAGWAKGDCHTMTIHDTVIVGNPSWTEPGTCPKLSQPESDAFRCVSAGRDTCDGLSESLRNVRYDRLTVSTSRKLSRAHARNTTPKKREPVTRPRIEGTS